MVLLHLVCCLYQLAYICRVAWHFVFLLFRFFSKEKILKSDVHTQPRDASTTSVSIGADLLLEHGEVLCKHKQSNEDNRKYTLLCCLPQCVGFREAINFHYIIIFLTLKSNHCIENRTIQSIFQTFDFCDQHSVQSETSKFTVTIPNILEVSHFSNVTVFVVQRNK